MADAPLQLVRRGRQQQRIAPLVHKLVAVIDGVAQLAERRARGARRERKRLAPAVTLVADACRRIDVVEAAGQVARSVQPVAELHLHIFVTHTCPERKVARLCRYVCKRRRTHLVFIVKRSRHIVCRALQFVVRMHPAHVASKAYLHTGGRA